MLMHICIVTIFYVGEGTIYLNFKLDSVAVEHEIFFFAKIAIAWKLLVLNIFLFFISGTFGYVGTSVFVRKIYSTVKID